MSIAYGYFYFVNQAEQSYIKTSIQGNVGNSQQNQEYLVVTGALLGPVVGFVVGNSGIPTTITSFLIIESSTGTVLEQNSGSSSTPALPYAISQGQSEEFTSNVLYTEGQKYTIEVMTSRGSEFVGTYPPKSLNTQVANALVAAGLGSVSMNFSSYDYYSVSSTGNSYSINFKDPHSANILPYKVTPLFALQITNNDPYGGSITIDSHSELYLYQTCATGCGGNVPVFAYFIVNVASNGTITSRDQGSFVPIVVPVNETVTLYFASKNDLSLNSFSTLQINGAGNKVGLGEYDVFEILSGSDARAQGAILYGQNLPFAGSFLADNIAWFSESPTDCTHSAQTQFTLTLKNSQYSTYQITQVSINASEFSNLQSSSVKIPQYWTYSINNGVITWSSTKTGGNINAGNSASFPWNGTAPGVVGSLATFPIMVTWSSGTVTTQQSAVGCFLN